MRKDRFRINGPESTFINLIEQTALDANNRRDGRQLDQMRSVFGDVGIIANADGSSLMEADKIKVVCGVHIKPALMSRSQCQFDFKFAPFSTQRRSGFIKNNQEKEFSRLLEQAIRPAILFNNSKSFLDVYVTVLEADGVASSLALAITCASMALVDAGVEMSDVVIGSAIVIKSFIIT